MHQFVPMGTKVSFGSFTGPVEWQIDTLTHILTCHITLRVGERSLLP
ncbi:MULTISPECIES: hypothetical protein [Nostocales]|uniref:Uncharacterized protein n=3 Tax=Nostocales TaxID=1161 RepID=A0A8S9T5L1_9CYAN|nr:hypothetical protein [Tolypothrix bouteillei]KAF3886974.1 hypothetical protein DA73_0400016905 [Tolypothrix bouteillei VB521301]